MKRRSNKRVIFLLKYFPKSPFFRGRSMAKRLRNESFELDVMETVKRCNSAIYCPSTRLVTCHHPVSAFSPVLYPWSFLIRSSLHSSSASFLPPSFHFLPPSVSSLTISSCWMFSSPPFSRYFRRSPPHHAYPPLSSTRPKNPLIPSPFSLFPTYTLARQCRDCISHTQNFSLYSTASSSLHHNLPPTLTSPLVFLFFPTPFLLLLFFKSSTFSCPPILPPSSPHRLSCLSRRPYSILQALPVSS